MSTAHPPSRPMDDRTAVVTGGTSGIGREVALGLARMGATTILVGRGEDRTRAVAAEIAHLAGNPRVEPLAVVDLAERREMVRVSDEILRRAPRLEVLVNNAGAIFTRREVTTDGLERTFALNVLAPFVLTTRLGERLRTSAPARVIMVSSAAHRGMRLDFDDLQGSREYSGWRAYGRSKLALILLTRELARRWAGSGIGVNAVHPGFVRSGFAQNTPGGFSILVRVSAAIGGRSSRKGAETPLFVATDPGLASTTGAYFSNRRPIAGSSASRDPATARRLYELCGSLAPQGVPAVPAAIVSAAGGLPR